MRVGPLRFAHPGLLALSLAAIACACGGLSISASLDVPGDATETSCAGWTAREPMCAAPLTLFQDRDVARPIAVVAHPGYLAIDWSMPDDATDRGEARVVLLGVELSGWAPLSEREFALRAAHTLSPSVLRAPAGSPVRIVGRDGLGLRVELASPFRAPSVVRATIGCDDLGPPEPSDTPAALRARVGARGDRLAVRAAPGASVALGVELYPGALFWLLEEDAGWAHVQGPETGDATLTLDGWVEAAAITRDVELSSDAGCHPTDDSDLCPDAIVERTTTIDVGPEPGVPSRLRVRAQTEVSVVDRREGHYAIAPSVTGLAPPEGSRFWIPADAISPCSDEDAGCSCP